MNRKYMLEAIKEAKKGMQQNEVPVGAIIVQNNKIIARAYNKKELEKCSICHAEIIAIKEASKKIGNWRLNECVLITTLKPCKMCAEVINACRISKVYYILEQDNTDYEYNYEKITENSEFIDKYIRLFNNFFKKLR